MDQEQRLSRGESQTGPGTSESGRDTFGSGTETESGRATFGSGTESESGRARDQELESKEYDTKSRSQRLSGGQVRQTVETVRRLRRKSTRSEYGTD